VYVRTLKLQFPNRCATLTGLLPISYSSCILRVTRDSREDRSGVASHRKAEAGFVFGAQRGAEELQRLEKSGNVQVWGRSVPVSIGSVARSTDFSSWYKAFCRLYPQVSLLQHYQLHLLLLGRARDSKITHGSWWKWSQCAVAWDAVRKARRARLIEMRNFSLDNLKVAGISYPLFCMLLWLLATGVSMSDVHYLIRDFSRLDSVQMSNCRT
jgi:hypothetical protein